MNLFGNKTVLITLPDTEFNRKRSRSCASVKHGCDGPKRQAKILSITFLDKPRPDDIYFCVVIQFPNGKGFPVTARAMTDKEKRQFNRWKR